MKIEKIHHVAYRCNDAKETVEWYGKNLGMDFVLAIAEDFVPSTHEPDPYMHVFLDAGDGNVLAFFELPTKPKMGFDPNTPRWVQHIACKVKDRETLVAYKDRLEANGIEVLGGTDHSIFHSIYFFDPTGTEWSWPAPIRGKRRRSRSSTPSNGRCWKNGPAPSARRSTPNGCMRKSCRRTERPRSWVETRRCARRLGMKNSALRGGRPPCR